MTPLFPVLPLRFLLEKSVDTSLNADLPELKPGLAWPALFNEAIRFCPVLTPLVLEDFGSILKLELTFPGLRVFNLLKLAKAARALFIGFCTLGAEERGEEDFLGFLFRRNEGRGLATDLETSFLGFGLGVDFFA